MKLFLSTILFYIIFNLIKYTKEVCSLNCESKYSRGDCSSCKDGYYNFFGYEYLEDGYRWDVCCNCPSICLQCEDSNFCLNCISGYYLFNDYCYSCQNQCATCSGSANSCTSCYNGYYLDNNQCLKCDYNCKTCSGSSNRCLSC